MALARNSVIVLFLLLLRPLLALDPHTKITDFVHTKWSGDAPFDAVYNLAQTKDGYLWASTGAGLFRFDGVRFSRFEPLSTTEIRRMIATRDGSLWLVTVTGRVSRLFHGQVTTFPLETLPRSNGLAEDRDGSVVVATANGLARFGEGAWAMTPKAPELRHKPYSGVWLDRDGALYLATMDRFLKRASANDPFVDTGIHAAHGMLPNLFSQSPDGTAWLANEAAAYGIRPGERPAQIGVPATVVLADRQGSVWIGTNQDGLWRVADPQAIAGKIIKPTAPDLENFARKNGLSGNWVFCALEDREGSLWIGTDHGLDRFRDAAFHRVDRHDEDVITSMLGLGDGSVLVLLRNRPYLQKVARDGKIGIVQLPEPGRTGCLDTNGEVWLATAVRLGRWTSERLSYPLKPTFTDIRALTCREGEIWLWDAAQGVFRIKGGIATKTAGFPGNVHEFFVERPGRVWASLYDGRLVVYENGKIREYGPDDGLPPGAINSIGGLEGDIWFAGEGGLARFRNGRFENIVVTPGLPLHNLVSFDASSLWLHSGQFVMKMDLQEFDRATSDRGYRPHVERYGPLDGLLGMVNGIQKSRKRLWVETSESFGYVDIDELRRIQSSLLPPPVEIETLTADGAAMPASQEMALPKFIHNVQIDYTALSLKIPERIQFRYKLEGVDKNWQDARTRRQAYYNDLAPKNYYFVVQASNNTGVWSEGAALHFLVLPAYYQTRWFQAASVAALLALVWAFYRYRLRQIAQHYNLLLEERVGERTRIARELHDTLLQSFQGLMLRFQVVDDMLPPGQAKEQLQQSLERADQAIAEGRSAVYDLRSSTTPTNDLAQAVQAAANELVTPGSPAFGLVVEGSVKDLHPIIRDEVYRIGCEALRNAFRHAWARRVETKIMYGEKTFCLRVCDDGTGIPCHILEGGREDHYGLGGMRERARQIRGKLEIRSKEEKGTEIELTITNSIAYSVPKDGATFRSWRKQGNDS